ncbi:hypothetical protein MSAN_02443300 [Mycena sanguinolenta]|uniref:Uncharacterized protein n=1 Tax=Mycena sanguinolenta TaxID=230812 RepID=A0A8H7CCJ3_9AGAR|nr:hypothetical protein MSAN_02443300 [Mycena sanguinolenta]
MILCITRCIDVPPLHMRPVIAPPAHAPTPAHTLGQFHSSPRQISTVPPRKLLHNDHERTREGGAKTEAFSSGRLDTLISSSLCGTLPAIPLQRYMISERDTDSTPSD